MKPRSRTWAPFLRFALHHVKNKLAAQQQRKWKNSTEVEGRPLGTQKMRQKKTTKILTKAESRELSPQLSVHQEDSPSESTLASLITEAAQEVQQKRKGSEHQLQEVHFFLSLFFFFFFCSFGSTKSGPRGEGGRGGGWEEDGRQPS